MVRGLPRETPVGYRVFRGLDRRVTRIELTTSIRAPREVGFDLARDLDLHLRSMAHTGERAVAGRTNGLIGPGEEVTWRARHFGVVHHHASRITAFEPPSYFRDSMVAGSSRPSSTTTSSRLQTA